MGLPEHRIVSFEGISGVGKTHYLRQLHERHYAEAIVIRELSDRSEEALEGAIMGCLRQSADPFFRGGNPRTETHLLSAIKTLDYERHIRPELGRTDLFFEDRSVDTIAVYQALLVESDGSSSSELTRSLFALACGLRPPPSLTLLLVDDFSTCLERLESRRGSPIPDSDSQLLQRAAAAYEAWAALNPGRIVRVDRREYSESELSNHLRTLIDEHRFA